MVYETQKERYKYDRQEIFASKLGNIHGCFRAALEDQVPILAFTNRFMSEPTHKQAKSAATQQPVILATPPPDGASRQQYP